MGSPNDIVARALSIQERLAVIAARPPGSDSNQGDDVVFLEYLELCADHSREVAGRLEQDSLMQLLHEAIHDRLLVARLVGDDAA